MIAELRRDFNARFTQQKYEALTRQMNRRTRTELAIRLAETPVFLPAPLLQRMVDAGAEMTQQLVSDAAYLRAAAETIPPAFRVAGQDEHPNFMTVDFGLVHDGTGAWDGDWRTLSPRLVELQAFPSVYGYQAELSDAYRQVFDIDPRLRSFLTGLDERAYWALMSEVVLAGHAPEHVVLMEIDPDLQKTVTDFHVHEDRLGIRTVDVRSIYQRGRALYYDRDGVETRVKRIYNRAIVDEMVRKQVRPGFAWTADLDVEWAGHPNWYFLLSKFSLPYLRRPDVPAAVFLDRWMRGECRDALPADPSQLVLKPLFSFAGKGIEFAPSLERLESIPMEERSGYLLQQKVGFEPAIATPFGMTQAEVRILYLWPAHGRLTAVNTLIRLGRGAMMGVDHNKNQQWVGGSSGFILNDVG